MKTAEQKRQMNRITGFFKKLFGTKKHRRRDDCPKWVKKEALAKAKAKRKMRADKLRKPRRHEPMRISPMEFRLMFSGQGADRKYYPEKNGCRQEYIVR